MPDAVKRLVDRFDLGRKVFLSGDYKEEQLPEAKTPCEEESLQRQIDADDKAINTLVYERHGPDGRQYRSAVLEARG